MDDFTEIDNIITIKNRFSNRMEGSFILYRSSDDELESIVTIKQHNFEDLNSTLSAKVTRNNDLSVSLEVKYHTYSDLESGIEAISAIFLESMIEVKPHNQMAGSFELIEAPKITINLPPIADATTRSREDLRTINYGDTRSMLTGKSIDEDFKSFIQFADINKSVPDLKYLNSARLRLFFANFPVGTNLELHQPDTLWREMGITHANEPYSTQLLSNQYTINTKERYVEFDILDIALKWQSGELDNYGLIIGTNVDDRLTFFTRESEKPPQLIINYTTSQIYSTGRSDLESSIFVHGKGNKDISGLITVHSDIGISPLESTIYVHQAKDPMFNYTDAIISSSRPDLNASFVVQRRENEFLDGLITVANLGYEPLESTISINKPDMFCVITVDPNMSLPSIIDVPSKIDLYSFITVSRPDLSSELTVSDYTRMNEDMGSLITIKTGENEDLDSIIIISIPDLTCAINVRAIESLDLEATIQVPDVYDFDGVIGISHPDLNSVIEIRGIGLSDKDSFIEVPYYSGLQGLLGVSHPDLNSLIEIKYTSEIESLIYIKEKTYLDAVIDVKNITELSGFLMIKNINEVESEISVNHPDLYGCISPRVLGEKDLGAVVNIKRRNVSDLNSYISVRGTGNKNFVIII